MIGIDLERNTFLIHPQTTSTCGEERDLSEKRLLMHYGVLKTILIEIRLPAKERSLTSLHNLLLNIVTSSRVLRFPPSGYHLWRAPFLKKSSELLQLLTQWP